MKRILIFMLIYILAASAFFALPMNLADNTPVVKEKTVAAPMASAGSATETAKKSSLSGWNVLAAAAWPLRLITACSNSTDSDPINQNPTANAGTNQNVTLASGLSVTLTGTGSDTDGSVASYAWTLKTKPAGAADPAIASANTASTAVSGFKKAGDYEFQLIVTDNEGAASAASVVKVTVAPVQVQVNLASFTLPSNSLDLTPSKGTGWTGLPGTLSSTLSETDEGGNPTTHYNISGSTISIPGGFTGHPWPPPPRITQTFTYDGKTIGSIYFNLRAQNTGTYQFTEIYKWSETFGPVTSFPGAWNPALTIDEL